VINYKFFFFFSPTLSLLKVIAGSVEAFSIAFSVFVVLKLGLRVNLFIYMIIAGIACVLINFARADYLGLTISLAMIGKRNEKSLSLITLLLPSSTWTGQS